MIKKPCKNRCTTTSLAADVICRGCGLTDDERRLWGSYSDAQKVSVIEVCKYRLDHYEECVEQLKR